MDTLERIGQQVADAGWQLIVETVTRTDADEELCSVVIEDGYVKE